MAIKEIGREEHNPANCRETKKVIVTIPGDMSHTGKERLCGKPIDFCLADIVDSLNKGGIKTRGSCCGHGAAKGTIILNDGRQLLIEWPDDWCKSHP